MICFADFIQQAKLKHTDFVPITKLDRSFSGYISNQNSRHCQGRVFKHRCYK
jgi:hypothetical protein